MSGLPVESGATVVTGIGELVTNDPSLGEGQLGLLQDAALVISEGHIAWVGPTRRAPAGDEHIDVSGRAIVPGFVDSHAHLVFGGDRAQEFEARMAGERYDGGGIAATVAATRQATDTQLRHRLETLVSEMRQQGTTTVEVKSGYGLNVADERRALRLAGEVTEETTFLGAHVLPPEMRDRREEYVDLVCGEMLNACAPYARWIDVFCEPASPHAFDGQEARTVLQAGQRAGLGLRVHANQLSAGPGIRLAVELGAASVDHCTFLSEDDVAALAGGQTVATLLPGVEFSTRMPYPDARRLLEAGATVALASDCNPGTSYTSSMPLCIALAVREMNLSVAEALWAASAGGARALRRSDIGHLGIGARADIALLEAPSYRHLAYRPGVPLASTLEHRAVN